MIPQILFSLLVIGLVGGTICDELSCVTLVYADSFGDSSFSSGGYSSSFGDSSFGGSSFDYGGSSFGSSSFGGSSFDYGGYGDNSFGGNSFMNDNAPSPSTWENGKSWVQDGKEQVYNVNGITKEGFTKEQVYEKAQFNNQYGHAFDRIHYGYPVYTTYWGYGGYYYGHSDFWFNWYMFTLILNQQEANQQKQLEQLAINNATDVHYDTKQHKYISGK